MELLRRSDWISSPGFQAASPVRRQERRRAKSNQIDDPAFPVTCAAIRNRWNKPTFVSSVRRLGEELGPQRGVRLTVGMYSNWLSPCPLKSQVHKERQNNWPLEDCPLHLYHLLTYNLFLHEESPHPLSTYLQVMPSISLSQKGPCFLGTK